MTTLSLPQDSVEERACSVGFPSEHVEVRVVNTQSRRTVPIGEAGELCVRGYNVMRGYWDEPLYAPECPNEHHILIGSNVRNVNAFSFVSTKRDPIRMVLNTRSQAKPIAELWA